MSEFKNIQTLEIVEHVTENGELVNQIGGTLYPRSIVLVNKACTKVVNINAVVRKPEPKAIVKAMLKACLMVQGEIVKINSTEAADATKRRVANPLSVGLSNTFIMVTDGKGKLMKQHTFRVNNDDSELTLRKLFRITPSNPLYDLVIVQHKGWDDLAVQSALLANITRTFELMGAMKRIDNALDLATTAEDRKAVETEVAEIEAAEKAEKKPSKAKKAA